MAMMSRARHLSMFLCIAALTGPGAVAQTPADPAPVPSALEQGNLAYRKQDYAAAERHLQQALRDQPGDAAIAHTLARAVVYQRARTEARAPVLKPLVDGFPNDGYLASFHGFALAQDNNLKAAVQEFDRARRLGTEPAQVLPRDQVAKIEDRVRPSFSERVLWLVGGFTAFYATVMLLMAATGMMLARWSQGQRALKLLDKPPDQLVMRSQVMQTQHESMRNRIYGFVLLVVLVLFYASIPFIVTGLTVLTLILLLLTFFVNRDPDIAKLHGNLLRASSGGIWAVLKGLFSGFDSGGFGIRKTAEQCPRLYQALTEVAKRIDTDPVDEVWLAPGSEIGVHQEGRGPFGLFGSKKRVLTLGLATLPFLTISELKSILAHEYAHFSHNDTFYNRFIAQISLSIALTRKGMAESGGWVTWVNPFYWFFYLYAKAYGLLSAGFSRSREFLADRMACCLYGSDVFGSALGKVITEGMLFDLVMPANIIERLLKRKAFINMYQEYRMFRVKDLTEAERDKARKKLLDEKASLFASHPTYEERVAAAAVLPKSSKKDTSCALALLEQPAEVGKELTDFLTGYINQRIRIVEV
jgi:Zn-dependent protease with chaperone function